jgi:hypothetical protein
VTTTAGRVRREPVAVPFFEASLVLEDHRFKYGNGTIAPVT